ALGTHRTSAVTTPATISSLEAKAGWASGSWQDKLLKAADQSGNKDGKVTRAELDTYLAGSPDLKFLTSSQLTKMGTDVGTGAKVGGFSGWQGKVAQAADKNKDGTVSADEFKAYSDGVKAGNNASTSWVGDQKGAAVLSGVAMQTGEADGMNA